MFYKQQEDPLGSCSPGGQALLTFVRSLQESLSADHLREFLRRFLGGMSGEAWSGAALVYVARALAQLAPAPLIGLEVLLAIKLIVTQSLRTMQVKNKTLICWSFLSQLLYRLS